MFINGTPATPRNGPTSRRRSRPIDDGTWKNYSGRLTWQAIAAQQDRRLDERPVQLPALRRGRLPIGPVVHRPDRLARGAEPRTKTTRACSAQVSWSSPVTNRMLLEANVGARARTSGGAASRRIRSTATLIPVQDDGGAIPGINYRSALTGPTTPALRTSTRARCRT